MIKADSKEDLRRRAEEILAKRDKQLTFKGKEVYEVVEELNLYHIELEIQNEHLIKAQEELQASHDKYADLYNLAPVAYFTLNSEGMIIDVNQSGLELLGLKRDSLINRCFSLYIFPEHQMLFSQFRQRVSKDKLPQSFETKLIKWSGPPFDALIECRSVQGTYDHNEQFLICARDISDRKLSEQAMQLQRAKISAIDRMRSMNEQIYTLTRQQNHSLTVMSNYISGCIRRLETQLFNAGELLQTLRKVSFLTTELTNMILQMQNLASKSVLRYEFTDINTIIADTLALIGFESIEFPVVIQYEKIHDLPTVKVDKLHIQHVILSLARNAIEAMQDAKISTPKLLIEARLEGKGEIVISILDNGPGFESTSTNKLFEPNYTTKSYALGLGLATSRTIVEKHGGQLSAQLNPAGGASFQFTLPCVASTL